MSMWVSGVGTWAQTTALILYVRSLGGEGIELGLITAAQFLPILLFGMLAGAVADRVDRHRLTINLQIGAALNSAALGVAVMAGLESMPALYAFTAVGGLLTAFDNPSRRTLVTELADPNDLANVTALSTSTITGSRMIGPLIAAVLFTAIGPGWVFILNAVSFGAMVLGLRRLDTSRFRRIPPSKRSPTPIRDGLKAVWADPVLQIMVATFAVVSTFGYNHLVSLPLLINEVLKLDDSFLGWILSTMSAGNIVGSLLIARQINVSPKWFFGAGGVLSTCLLAISVSTSAALTVAIGIVLGIASTSFVNSTAVILQQRASEQMRSRILALSSVLFLGSTPIGGPITGLIGDAFGAAWAVRYGGLISLAAAGIGVVTLNRTRSAF